MSLVIYRLGILKNLKQISIAIEFAYSFLRVVIHNNY